MGQFAEIHKKEFGSWLDRKVEKEWSTSNFLCTQLFPKSSRKNISWALFPQINYSRKRTFQRQIIINVLWPRSWCHGSGNN